MLIKLITTGTFGLIFLSATATVYIGSQLERSQCASLSLPLDYKIMLGAGCKKQMAADNLRFLHQDVARIVEDHQLAS